MAFLEVLTEWSISCSQMYGYKIICKSNDYLFNFRKSDQLFNEEIILINILYYLFLALQI